MPSEFGLYGDLVAKHTHARDSAEARRPHGRLPRWCSSVAILVSENPKLAKCEELISHSHSVKILNSSPKSYLDLKLARALAASECHASAADLMTSSLANRVSFIILSYLIDVSSD